MDLGGICSSPLWNQTVSWDTKDPYLTECFKHLILVTGSCGVLWLVAPFEFVKICRYPGNPTPWTSLSIAKIVCKAILLVICTVELVKETYAYMYHLKEGLDGLIAAVAYFVTIVLTVVLTLMCKRHGLRSSIALPSFWMISTVATVISVYDDIHAFEANSWVTIVSLVDDLATFVISLIQLILSNIIEKGTSTYGRQLMDNCPLDESSFLSRLTFSWLMGVLVDSSEKSLHHEDLIPLCSEFKSGNVARRFCEIWNKNYKESARYPEEATTYHTGNIQQSSRASQERLFFNQQNKQRSLLAALLKISAPYLLLSSVFEILYSAVYFLPVYILSLYLNAAREPQWHQYVYSVILFIALLFSTLLDSQRKYYGLVSAFRIKTAVVNAIFEKALVSQKLQNVEKHLQEETENIFQMASLLSEVWGTFLRVLIGFYLLWLFLGTTLIGVSTATFCCCILLVIIIDCAASYYERKTFGIKSQWMDVFSECLYGIRHVKFNAWEEFYLRKIRSLRKLESSKLRRTLFLKMIVKVIIVSTTSLVSLATFVVYMVISNTFDMKIIVLSFATIFLLKLPFTNVLRLLMHLIQGLISIRRVQAFLESKEVQNLSVSTAHSRCHIRFENAAFSWNNSSSFQLKNLTFKADDDSLIAIVGESLSGKSSLLRALIGEMEKLEGIANVKGEIALVSGNLWIQNASLEENILFSRLKVDSIYNNTLKACDLLQDIENLPQGEETEVGEKGYPLSTSQKVKVDLARAIYQNADIYLLDDPLGSIDTSVAKYLFLNIIGPSGILHNKIRIFTTTTVEFLSDVDHILFLEEGKILEQGSYSDLIEKNGSFAEYYKSKKYPSFSSKRNDRELTKSRHVFNFENFKSQYDPWYSDTGLSLKAEPENFMQGEIMTAPKALLRKLGNYIKTNSCLFIILSIIMAFIANCCEVSSLIWLKWHASDYNDESVVDTNLYIYVGIIFVQVLFTTICGIILSCGNTLTLGRLYHYLLNRIMRAPLMTFNTTFVKRILVSFDKDLQLFEEDIPIELFMWFVTLIKIPVTLVAILAICPLLTLIFLPLIVVFFILQKLYMNAWRQLHHLSACTRNPLFNLLQSIFQGISNIRTSNTSLSFISRFHTKQDNHNKCNFLFLLVSRWLSSSVEIIGSLLVLFTTIMLISQKGVDNPFTGLAVILTLLIPEYLINYSYLSSVIDIDLSCAERFQSFSNVKQEAEWTNHLSHPWPVSGSIATQNLNTAYGDGLYPVLEDINITIESKEKVAIIGKEGSGVSTILDSLFRIREIFEGEIFIDNVDISSVGLHDLRSKLAIIPEDPFIFKGTLRENLDPEQNHCNEDLQQVMKMVGLDFKVNDIRNCTDMNLSNEDKYRIALARGKLKMSKIVIMDGADSSLSGEKHFQNCTLVLFGNSCDRRHFDRVIHISSGEVVKEETSDSFQ